MRKLEATFSCVCLLVMVAAAVLFAAGMTGLAFLIAWGGSLSAWLLYATVCSLVFFRGEPAIKAPMRDVPDS